jgi:N-acetylneuraminic acid mutarotase
MKKTTTILAILFATVFSVNAQNYYPEPRTGHTMTLIGNYIYMFGGETQAKQAKNASPFTTRKHAT